jgi:hypothetical protein
MNMNGTGIQKRGEREEERDMPGRIMWVGRRRRGTRGKRETIHRPAQMFQEDKNIYKWQQKGR